MSGDDEIERLLREVDAMSTGKGSSTPAVRGGAPAPSKDDEGLSPVGTGLVAGAVCGVGVGGAALLWWLVPFLPGPSPLTMGAGAFVGAFLTGAVMSRRRKR
jgi:hypothetical protein